ncbi:hypothetical protein DIPPA_03838 [Diplonema papillatum]|nr:hypothetical protein DIPPA_03838 [Diplonema papillatum]
MPANAHRGRPVVVRVRGVHRLPPGGWARTPRRTPPSRTSSSSGSFSDRFCSLRRRPEQTTYASVHKSNATPTPHTTAAADRTVAAASASQLSLLRSTYMLAATKSKATHSIVDVMTSAAKLIPRACGRTSSKHISRIRHRTPVANLTCPHATKLSVSIADTTASMKSKTNSKLAHHTVPRSYSLNIAPYLATQCVPLDLFTHSPGPSTSDVTRWEVNLSSLTNRVSCGTPILNLRNKNTGVITHAKQINTARTRNPKCGVWRKSRTAANTDEA